MINRRVVSLLFGGIFALGSADLAVAQEKEIVIGVATALTGPGAATGRQVAAGVRQASNEVNAAGGINGVSIRVAVEDDRSQPGGSVNAFNKLASMKPAIIVGPTWTNFINTLAPIIKRTEIPVVTTAIGSKITDPEVSGGWIFRAAPTDHTIANVLIDYTTKALASKKVAIIYPNDEYGKSGYKIFKDAGTKFVAEETYNFGDKDVSAQVLKLKAAEPDDVVLWAALPSDAGLITNQIRQFMPNTRIIGSPALAVDEYYKLAQGGAEGAVTVAAWVPGLTSASEDWAKRMKEGDPDVTISFTSAENYDGAMIAFEAIKGARDLQPATLRAALAGIKAHKGVLGNYTFDERGDGFHSAVVVEWKNGVMNPLHRADTN
jgi:branched-chain amino acid transport system substrate-binding protein